MSEDLIKRSDAIEAIHSYWKGELSKMPTTDSEYGEVIDGDFDTLLKHNKELSTRIKDIPSADRPSAVDLSSVYSTAYKSRYEKGKADRPQGWIPCSERLPEDLEVVNITWVNHRPVCYYSDIKDKPFTATAIHYKDKWWWYSPICEDLLAEYGKSECDKMDADIEVIAWMPLPKPYEEGKENE